ncbi:MAG: hypothetical protein CMJ44_15500 [Pimelobacter sp.]|nr:hypothetical protein [Pimelobacter sp.]
MLPVVTAALGAAALLAAALVVPTPAGAVPPGVTGSASLAATATSSASTPAEPRARGSRVASSRVGFDLVNTNSSSVLCLPLPDGKGHRVRGRLVAPRAVLSGRRAVVTVNVLVHDAGTGGWFFNLRRNPTYDYATQLAKRGQTSLVLDRLGYGRSPLKDGGDTCLGAQVHMLHQVVQHLYGGRYDYLGTRSDSTPPHASHVVLQGHGTGATIAQLEAARFDDVAGLVLMAPATTSPSQVALQAVGDQAGTCLDDTFAPYGATAADFRRLLFATAPRGLRKAAVARRNPTPCGDVASLPGALASITLGDRDVEMPVLVLRGGKDARTSGGRVSITSESTLTRRSYPRSGSALTLEKSAPKMQRAVARWLRRL